jgi:hypothetical protein
MTKTTLVELITTCAWCATRHAMATGLGAGVVLPGDGDATLCFTCGKINIFDGTAAGGLRKPTAAETNMLDRDETVATILRAWSTVKKGNTP